MPAAQPVRLPFPASSGGLCIFQVVGYTENPILVSLRVVCRGLYCLFTLWGGEGLVDQSGQFHGLSEAIPSCLLSVLLRFSATEGFRHGGNCYTPPSHPSPPPPTPHPSRFCFQGSLSLGLSLAGSSLEPSMCPAALASSDLTKFSCSVASITPRV